MSNNRKQGKIDEVLENKLVIDGKAIFYKGIKSLKKGDIINYTMKRGKIKNVSLKNKNNLENLEPKNKSKGLNKVLNLKNKNGYVIRMKIDELIRGSDSEIGENLKCFLKENFKNIKFSNFPKSQLFLLQDKLTENNYLFGDKNDTKSPYYFIENQIKRGKSKDFYLTIRYIFGLNEEDSIIEKFMENNFQNINLDASNQNEWFFYKIKKYIKYKIAVVNMDKGEK